MVADFGSLRLMLGTPGAMCARCDRGCSALFTVALVTCFYGNERIVTSAKKLSNLNFLLFKKIFFVKLIVIYLKKKDKLNNRFFKTELISFSVYMYILLCMYSSQIFETLIVIYSKKEFIFFRRIL